jgi:hypothetical protein
MHGDVDAGVADGLARGGEAAGIAEFGEDRDRGQRAHPVVAHQRPTAGLAVGVVAQLPVERRELRVERVDHRQRDRDLLACRGRQLQVRQPCARLGAEQPAARRDTVVIEHRLDPLLPLAALVDERVAQPHPAAQLVQMPGRDPRLRQPPGHQQLAQMSGVGAIALGTLLGAAARRRLRRLGQVDLRPDRLELLDREAPARCRLQRNLELLAPKAGGEASHSGPVRRRDTAARDLAGRGIQPLGGDLRPMLVESHYDRHKRPPQAPRSETPTRPSAALELRSSLPVRQDGPRHMPSMSKQTMGVGAPPGMRAAAGRGASTRASRR